MVSRIWKLGLVGASGIFLRKFSHGKSNILYCEEETPQTPLTKRCAETGQCILVVGTTGSGKSSTIAKMTGQNLNVGHQTQSVTRECSMFSRIKDGHNDDPVWIDTVGYDDTKCLEDEDSFKEVLRYISENRLLKVAAVIWTVLPQERCDSRLQKQAEFIDQFRPGRIWDNVIIVAKQPGSFNLERAVQGAREAALQLPGAEGKMIQCLGFTYMDSSIPLQLQESLQALGDIKRKEMLIANNEEVVEQLEEALDKIKEPVQVVFEDVECYDCGTIGDRRLLPAFCHMEELYTHPGTLAHFHTEQIQSIHPLPVEARHPGVLKLGGGNNEECCRIRNIAFGITPLVGFFDPSFGIGSALAAGGIHFLCKKMERPIAYFFTCCQGDQNAEGCKPIYGCCRKSEGKSGCSYVYPCCAGGPQAPGCARRYHCCDKEEGAAGCKIVCKKCGHDWGSPAGECYRKKHELRRI